MNFFIIINFLNCDVSNVVNTNVNDFLPIFSELESKFLILTISLKM